MRRTFVRFFLIFLVAVAVTAFGFTFWLRDRYVVPILVYHHINASSDTSLTLLTVSQKSFEYQMLFLKRKGFHVISFDRLVKGIQRGQAFARNTVVVQFDDGYLDNYTDALPILEKYEIPATIFLVSDLIGHTKGFLNWDQVKEMEAHGVIIGAHTRHHAYLPDLTLEQARDEVVGSKKIIEDHLGHPVDFFCYPSGGYTIEVKQLVKEAGFKAAVTTNRGKDRYNFDLFALNRIHIKNSDGRFGGIILWFKLSGYYNLFRQIKFDHQCTKFDDY